jgi:amidophosphoribosyltransferase
MCGIFGIANHSDAATLTYSRAVRTTAPRPGKYGDILVLMGERVHPQISGTRCGCLRRRCSQPPQRINAIGHTRYSTAGENTEGNAQPIVVNCSYGTVALVTTATLLMRRLFERTWSGRAPSFSPQQTRKSFSIYWCDRSRPVFWMHVQNL